MRIWLYLKIISIAEMIKNFFNAKLGAYYVEQNHKYADAFLKKFHKNKGDGTWQLGEPATWPRKSAPNPLCKHLKGGSKRQNFQFKDYNVAFHTFADGTQKIWCLNGCGFESRPGDDNWSYAWSLLEQSSNKKSSSEISSSLIKYRKVNVNG